MQTPSNVSDMERCEFQSGSGKDEVFAQTVRKEITNFVQGGVENSVLIFPVLPKRERFLTHKVVEEEFEDLCSFSVGVTLRRTAVCLKSRLIFAFNSGFCLIEAARKVAVRLCREKGLPVDFLSHSIERPPPSNREMQAPRRRQRRPDVQLYVPRGRKVEALKSDAKDAPAQAARVPSKHLLERRAPLATTDATEALTLEAKDGNAQAATVPSPHLPEGQASFPTTSAAEALKPDARDASPQAARMPSPCLPERQAPFATVHEERSPASHMEMAQLCGEHVDTAGDSMEASLEESHEDAEDSWDALFDETGECIDPDVLKNITKALGEIKVQQAQLDYSKFVDRSPNLSEEEYGHVLEMYDFPAEFKTKDLVTTLSSCRDQFSIKWVDDTHALAIFSSPFAATEALSLQNSLVKMRPVSEASKQSKLKIKHCSEMLMPYKPRPQTSASVARRLVSGALGMRVKVDVEQRRKELQVLKEAKGK
ncbi:hypothetical protein MRX96_058475 [Rhipicephalus microplus]